MWSAVPGAVSPSGMLTPLPWTSISGDVAGAGVPVASTPPTLMSKPDCAALTHTVYSVPVVSPVMV